MAEERDAGKVLFEFKDNKLWPFLGLLIGVGLLALTIVLWLQAAHGTLGMRGGGVGCALIGGPFASLAAIAGGVVGLLRPQAAFAYCERAVVMTTKQGETVMHYADVRRIGYEESNLETGGSLSLTLVDRNGVTIKCRASYDAKDSKGGRQTVRRIAAAIMKKIAERMQRDLAAGKTVTWIDGKYQFTAQGLLRIDNARLLPWDSFQAIDPGDGRSPRVQIKAGKESLPPYEGEKSMDFWPGYLILRDKVAPAVAASAPGLFGDYD